MRSFIFIISLLFFNNLSIYSQAVSHNEDFSFMIEGNINADSGVIHLEILVDSEYYPKGVKSMVAKVKNKKFFFSGHIPYPQGMRFTYGKGYYSDIFILEPGKQSVIVDLESHREVEDSESKTSRALALRFDLWRGLRHSRGIGRRSSLAFSIQARSLRLYQSDRRSRGDGLRHSAFCFPLGHSRWKCPRRPD